MRILAGCFLVAAAWALASPVPSEPFVSTLSTPLVGTWRLVSTEDVLTDGTRRPYPEAGRHGKGFLIYTADGHMCAQLMNPDRPQWKDGGHPTNAEKIAAFDGFSAYCGKYEVDEAHGILYHLPETAWMPSYVGTRRPRPFELRGDLLTFSGKVSDEPGVASYSITWRKVAAATPPGRRRKQGNSRHGLPTATAPPSLRSA